MGIEINVRHMQLVVFEELARVQDAWTGSKCNASRQRALL